MFIVNADAVYRVGLHDSTLFDCTSTFSIIEDIPIPSMEVGDSYMDKRSSCCWRSLVESLLVFVASGPPVVGSSSYSKSSFRHH